jgi:hypothetical protein
MISIVFFFLLSIQVYGQNYDLVDHFKHVIHTEPPQLNSSNFTALTVGSYEYSKWSCPIPYVINPNIVYPNNILIAIDYITKHTGWSFVQRTSQYSYIEFVDSSGCWSYLGRLGGRQEIGLNQYCDIGAAIHEIAHAIGIHHEQTRVDRDSFVAIQYSNIPTQYQSNFNKASAKNYGNYDFESLMHYDMWAFSSNNQKTIVPLTYNNVPKTYIGQRYKLSFQDIIHLNKLYASSSCSGTTLNHYVDDCNSNNIVLLGGRNINTFDIIYMVYTPYDSYNNRPRYRSKWPFLNIYTFVYYSTNGYWVVDYNGGIYAYTYNINFLSKTWYIYNYAINTWSYDTSSFFEYEECCTAPSLMVGNGFCNTEYNTEICHYDGGDCCLESCIPGTYDCSTHNHTTCIDNRFIDNQPTPSPTPQPTPLPTPSPTPSPTPQPTPLPTPSPTPSPTPQPTPLPTPSPTPQPTPLPTPSPTPSPTPQPTPLPTPSPTPSPTPQPTPLPTPSPTPSPTPQPTPLPTPSPTPSPTPQPTPLPTPSPTPSPTPQPTPLPTPSPTPSPTPQPTPLPTPSPTPSPTPQPTPLPTPSPTPSPTPQPTPLPTPQPTPSPTKPGQRKGWYKKLSPSVLKWMCKHIFHKC